MRFLQTGPISSRVKVAIVVHLVYFLYWFVTTIFGEPVAVEPSYSVLPLFYWLWFFLFFPQVVVSFLALVASGGYDHPSFIRLFFVLFASFPVSYLYGIIIVKVFQRLVKRAPKSHESHNAA
jgi:hypothetical protein